MYNSNDLREGMVVQTADREKLGKVRSFDVTHFQVGKGLFFKEDYAVSYDEIREIRDGVILLTQDEEHFLKQPLWPKTTFVNQPVGMGAWEDEEAEIRRPVEAIEPMGGGEPAGSEPGVVHIGSPRRGPKEG